MATYFFDVRDRERQVDGTAGIELGDDTLAIREATMIVWQLLSDASAEGRIGNVTVRIRTATGACIYEASTSPVDE